MPRQPAAGWPYFVTLIILACLVHGTMLVAAWTRTPGSAAQLIFLAIGALSMVLSAASSRSYAALCLAAFLWLGLWLKFIFHLFHPSALVEPIGAFDGSVAQYDMVMLASGTAFFAAALAFLLAPRLRLCTIPLGLDTDRLSNRVAWPQLWTYLVLFGICLGIALINIQLGIFQVGIAPLTILPKPGNALISLFLTTGYFFIISYFIHCDRIKGRSLSIGVTALIICVAVMSSSLLSRGVVVFHLMAVLLALAGIVWQQRTGRALLLFLGALILSGVTIFATIRYVEAGREVGFAPQSEVINDLPVQRIGGTLKSITPVGWANNTVQTISKLAVRRWLGVEGVMVAAGNTTSNSPELLTSLLSERGEIGKTSQYQHLAQSVYVIQNGNKFQFTTLPGPVGTFLFGGSVIYVFIGVLVLCLLAMALEKISQLASQNIFFTCFVAVFAANSVAQFGLTPLNQLPQIGYIFVLLLGFWCARWIAPHVSGTPLRHLLPVDKPVEEPN